MVLVLKVVGWGTWEHSIKGGGEGRRGSRGREGKGGEKRRGSWRGRGRGGGEGGRWKGVLSRVPAIPGDRVAGIRGVVGAITTAVVSGRGGSSVASVAS